MNDLNNFRMKVLELHHKLSGGSTIHEVGRDAIAPLLGLQDYNDGKLLNQIFYLEGKGFLQTGSNMGDRITVKGIDEVENDYPNFKVKQPSVTNLQAYYPNAFEDVVLRTVDDVIRKQNDPNKNTIYGWADIIKSKHPEHSKEEILRAIEILTDQGFFTKKNEKFTHQGYSIGTAKVKPTTTNTTYHSLSPKAYLYLEGRLPGKNSISQNPDGLYDNSTPFTNRRKLESLFESALKGISIIDNYIGSKTFEYLLKANSVPIKIITSSKSQQSEKTLLQTISDFKAEYQGTVEIKVADGKAHGRLVIIDDDCYILDHSIKNFGEKPSALVSVKDKAIKDAYLKLFDDTWSLSTSTELK